MNNTTQICKSCKKELPLTSEYFWRRRDYKLGFYSKCKLCESERDNIEAKKTQDLKSNKWTCTTCGKTLELNSKNFYRRNDSFTGYQFRCKLCLVKDPNRYDRLINKDDLSYYIKDRYHGAKTRSNNKGITFDITLEYLMDLWNKQNGLCAITKLPMTHSILQGKIKTNASVDRIDPKLGYVYGNIQWICNIINVMKSTMTLNELIGFCELITKNNEN